MFTTEQVAEHFKVTPRNVRLLAKRTGIGTLLTPRCMIFTGEEIEQLRKARRPVGRPPKSSQSA
jgi:hypothetical protein